MTDITNDPNLPPLVVVRIIEPTMMGNQTLAVGIQVDLSPVTAEDWIRAGLAELMPPELAGEPAQLEDGTAKSRRKPASE